MNITTFFNRVDKILRICYTYLHLNKMEEVFGQVLIDLFFLIICLRVIYTSISQGIIKESFRTLGLLMGAFFAFHYYFYLFNLIGKRILFLNREYFLFYSFLLIFLGVGVIFTLTRLIVTSFFKKREIPVRERVFLLGTGFFRASFLSSVIIFLLYLSPLDSKYFCHSISYRVFKNIGPKIYLESFRAYNKLNSEVIVNKEVEKYYEAKKSLSRGNKERH